VGQHFQFPTGLHGAADLDKTLLVMRQHPRAVAVAVDFDESWDARSRGA
jgi:hypothetical protein